MLDIVKLIVIIVLNVLVEISIVISKAVLYFPAKVFPPARWAHDWLVRQEWIDEDRRIREQYAPEHVA